MIRAVARVVFLSTIATVAWVAAAQIVIERPPLRPPKHGGVYVIAHRGAHEGIPENTLPAYEKAIELGCDFVEIDIRTTKDAQFVSIHNATVDAYALGATGKVAEMTLEELRALDIGARIGPEWEGTRIAMFDEILELCKGRIGIYLDLKEAPIAALAERIRAFGMEHDIVWYLSPNAVSELRAACPECIEMPDPGGVKNLRPVIESVRPRMVAPVWNDFSETYVKTCRELGVMVFVDERDRTSWEPAVKWGAHGIQTDHPAELIAFLKARNSQN